MAGKFAGLRLDTERLMGLAVRADASCVRDGACHRFHAHHWTSTAWAIRDDSLYIAESAFSRRLGRARAAIRQRLRTVDGEAHPICRRYRLRAEVLVGYRRDCS